MKRSKDKHRVTSVTPRHKYAWWHPGTLNKSRDLPAEEGEGLLHPAAKPGCTPGFVLPVCTGARLGDLVYHRSPGNKKGTPEQ